MNILTIRTCQKRILAILVVYLGILLSGCGNLDVDLSREEGPIAATIPQEKVGRDFLLGIVPSPKTVPESTFNDLVSAYEEAGSIADVVMIWGNPGGIGLYQSLIQNRVVTAVRVYGLKTVITLNFHTITQVPGQGLDLVIDVPDGFPRDASDPGFRERWISEAKRIALEFKPEYFSLGNEINDYFQKYPADLNEYLSLFDEAYAEIKTVSPQTKVFVVLSYNHLIENQQWDLLELFSGRADIIGLTTYPWKHYDSPLEIEEDYYARLNQYLDIPIAFTEIGWPSTNNEEVQVEFLARFLELTRQNDVEMVNWLFLHEMDVSGGIGQNVFSPETGTISLKKADGTKKLVFSMWERLYLGELK